MKYAGVCLLVAGVLFAVTARWLPHDPEEVRAAGERYGVTVLPADPVEVRVTSGEAETVTLAAVMPAMGHALPPVTAVPAGAGRFVAAGDVFSMNGVWELSITLSGARGREVINLSTVVTSVR
ncbi:FixH family protein [Nonomuraea gerenzanensis]|uniref:YtkA-like domain-containing protein n=1 Tax=Nonomuraea gerenzanensis TaxID=93944 RepID=A0A1M4E5P1_9ACTN|nr:FixH family protein [Nonomuraea gerenzanensis]UBU16337.1 FixH family protein [Nonomuraea gerenzanensis]SBO94156.1 hypothetical protein BN4615_P3672 [Nonomuraea gerenzanensis]